MSLEQNTIISIVIPVYQEEKILEYTLNKFNFDSLKKYGIELIISDGGSTDKTVEIAKKFTDRVVIHNEIRRQTIAEGRNKGAEIASGQTLVFINGDTFPDNPDAFFKFIYDWTLNRLTYSDRIALACKVYVEEKDRIFLDKIFYPAHNSYVRFLNFIGMGMCRGECQIVRKDAFNKVKGYNPHIAAGEDFDLYTRLVKIGKVKYANNLQVFESPRRFRKYGYLRVLLSWTQNSLSVMFKGKSKSEVWEAVR